MKPAYKSWTDPNEHAFSLDVPQGWHITGGLTRPNSVSYVYSVTATSPDGKSLIQLGNSYPTFTLPFSMPGVSAFPEGSTYSPGYGVSMPVKSYLPGAAAIGPVVLLPSGAQVDKTLDHPEIASRFPVVSGIGQRYDAGEVDFHFDNNGVPSKGEVGCITMEATYQIASMMIGVPDINGGVWGIVIEDVVAAPSSEIANVDNLAAHAGSTFKWDPTWLQAEQKGQAERSQIIAQANNDISNTINQVWANKQASEDEISRRQENATLGTVDVVDPGTNETFKIDNSSNYYWTDNQGNIVGTDISTSPGIDFQQMIALP